MACAESDLSRYRLVIMPNAYLVGDRFTRSLDDFVTGGGTVVEATRRETETMEYLFLLNHSADVPASVPVPPDGTDLISGTRVKRPAYAAAAGSGRCRLPEAR